MSSVATASGGVVTRRIPGAPLVAVRVVLPGGARREEIPGQALVCGRMLVEGTATRDWRSIAEVAEARGTSVHGFAAFELHGLAIDALAGEWRDALALAAELSFSSDFPAARLAWTARLVAAELEAQEDQADVVTARAFAAQLWSPHPKGRPLQGDPASLARLDSAVCRAFHESALRRGGFVVIAGEIDPEAVAAAAEPLFAALPAPRDDGFEPVPPPARAASRRELRTRARDQAHLLVGQRTVERRHADYEALELAGVALGAGAGLSGRVPSRIRDREGLAYTASADLVAGAGLDAGRLTAYVGTGPENVARAELVVREELSRLAEEGVTARELDDARSYLLGREPFRRETARQWADLAAYGALLGLPLVDPRWRAERLRAVTREAIRDALARHLDPGALAVTVGLPAR